MKNRCKEIKIIEDEICIMGEQCKLEENHSGSHKAHYPGIENNEVGLDVYWLTEDKTTEQIRRRDYK